MITIICSVVTYNGNISGEKNAVKITDINLPGRQWLNRYIYKAHIRQYKNTINNFI